MKKRITKRLHNLALLAIAALLCCCTDDREPFERPGGEKEKSLTFSVRIPVPAVPKTYALNETQENEVKDIDILVFDSSGTYTGLSLSGNTITTDDTHSNIKTFTVKVPEGNNYNMVILANCHDILSSASITLGDTKTSVMDQLLLSNAGKWDANTASGTYIAIPMWGEIADITVGSATNASNPVNLVRMLSKIDVSLDTTNPVVDFKLNSVRLYNYYDEGSVAPLPTNWNSIDKKVTAPSIPSTATRSTSVLTYTTTTADVSCIGEIYTFEAPAGTAATLATNTCLVIGGKYGTDTDETFYRIDFANTSSATPVYLPLLRNHSYKVNIKKISASGYATADEAFGALPINIEAGITVWDDAKITKMAYDDQYILGVSDDDLTFTREVRTVANTDNILSVTTDVPGGWKVAKIVDAADGTTAVNWLSLNDNSTTGTTDNSLIMSENNTGAIRAAVIHLVAGRLTLEVKVAQTTDSALSLSITNASNVEITDLVFAAATGVQPAAQTIRLNWMLVTQPVTVATAAYGGTGFAYSASSAKPGIAPETSYPGGSGTKYLSIQPTAFTPPANDPFQERISKVDFTVFNGVNYLSKSVFFRQMVPRLVVNQNTDYYLTNGKTYAIFVRSNTNWKIKTITENIISGMGSLLDLQASDNLRTTTTGGTNTDTGTPITFTVANNMVNLRGTVTIVFESADTPKRFNDVGIALNLTSEFYPPMHNGWAGSNIYWDGSKLTFDDVGVTTHQNYQGVFFKWGSLWGIDPSGTTINSNWSITNTVYHLNSGSYSTVTNIAWSSIPRVDDINIASNPPSGKTLLNRAYLYEITEPSMSIGDICKYMTEKGWAPGSPTIKWRMPTCYEFDTSSGAYTKSGTTWGNQISNSPTGQYQNPNITGWTKAGIGTPFFPASGNRGNPPGQLGTVGNNGSYWSSTPNNSNSSYEMSFNQSSVGAYWQASRDHAMTIRCVRE